MIFKKITIIVGYYGTGKTNFTLNLCSYLKDKGSTAALDMDTVNPYFRLADFDKSLESMGVTPFSTPFAGTSLDTPVIDYDLRRICYDYDYVILDTGGDWGAYALGKYHDVISDNGYEAIYVYNAFRDEDFTPEEAFINIKEIENEGRIKVSYLFNNSNLGSETENDTLEKSRNYENELLKLSGIKSLPELCLRKRIVKLPWEEKA